MLNSVLKNWYVFENVDVFLVLMLFVMMWYNVWFLVWSFSYVATASFLSVVLILNVYLMMY